MTFLPAATPSLVASGAVWSVDARDRSWSSRSGMPVVSHRFPVSHRGRRDRLASGPVWLGSPASRSRPGRRARSWTGNR